MSEQNNIGDTGEGFLVGVQPAQPQQASNWVPNGNPAQQVSQPIQVTQPQTTGAPPGTRFFTEEEIEKARREEKDKLYPRIQQMEDQLKAFTKEREDAQKAAARAAEEAEAARRAKEESEMDLRTLMEKRDKEWEQRFSQTQAQIDQERAVFQKERALQEVENYRIARLAQEAEYIMPELRDFVGGNTIEDVDASIEQIKERTTMILQNIMAAQQVPPPRGASPTAPAVGPMEQMTQYETLTPDDIKGMDMETYKRYRNQLLAATSRQYKGR